MVDEGKEYVHRFQPRQNLSSPQEGRFLLSDGEYVAFGFREEPKTLSTRAPLALEHDLLLSSRMEGFYAYRHFKLRPDELAFHGKDGSLRWKASLGDCRMGILLQEEGEMAYVLVHRVGKGEDVPTRLTLDLATGKVKESKDWTSLPEAEAKNGAYAAPLDLQEVALVLPAKLRYLVWIPSNGDMEPETGRKAQWLPEGAKADKEDGFKDPNYRVAYGHWCELTPDFKLLPRWGRPLADQVVVFPKGRPTPVYNWVNQGIKLGGPSTPFLFVGFGAGASTAPISPGFLASVSGQYKGRFPSGLFGIPAPLHFQGVFDEWLGRQESAAPEGQTPQMHATQAASTSSMP